MSRLALAMAGPVAERQFAGSELPLITDFAGPTAQQVLSGVEVLITSWGCPTIDETVLAAAPALKAVVHAAGSVRAIAGDAVWQRDIPVCSMADLNALPVAEYVIAMILLENKRVLPLIDEFRRTRAVPGESWYEPDVGNYRRRVGLISASRVGRRVAELLQPYDLEVLITDPYATADQIAALGARKVELTELLASCPVVSLHTPLLPETVGMIGKEELAALQDGAVLINTARGRIVDHDALIAELESGRIRAVLDVTDPEPPPPDSRLWELPNVVLSPHLAGSKGNELCRMADAALAEADRVITGETLRFRVPPERRHLYA